MGIIYRILFKSRSDNDDTKETSLILKIAPSDEMRRKTIGVRNLFLREISMYNEVISISMDSFESFAEIFLVVVGVIVLS